MEYLIIICIVIIFYIRTIEYSIIVDDVQHYGRIKTGRILCYCGDRSNAWQYFKKEKNKLKALKIIFKTEIWQRFYGGGSFGLNTIIDHAFTTFLHAVTCCLMYLASGQTQIAFWATLLYAVNPVNDQTAIWLNGRRYQIAIIFTLLALIFKPWGFLFYFPAVSFQVTSFFVPILFSDVSYLFLLAMPLVAWTIRKKVNKVYKNRMERIYNDDQKTWSLNRVKVVIKSYGWYFFKMIAPGKSLMNYPKMIEWGVSKEGNKDAYATNVDFFIGIMALVLTVGLCSIPELRLYGIFLFFAILQWSAVVCAFQQLTDRYISLTNVFMMYVFTYFVFSLNWYPHAIIMSVFAAYAVYLNYSMKMYRCIEDFFEYQSFYEPEMVRNRIIHADTFLQVKDVTRAWMIIERGLRYSPDDFELLYRGAVCSMSIGYLDKADEFIGKAEQNYYVGQEDFQKGKLDRLKEQMAMIIQRHNMSRQVKRANERKNK